MLFILSCKWYCRSLLFFPLRLKLNSKRNQLVQELEETTRLVAMLHTQLKRYMTSYKIMGSLPAHNVTAIALTASSPR